MDGDGMTADLRALLASLTEGLQPGPFHAVESGDKAKFGWWLDNAAGDSSFPEPADVALMVNALPALLYDIDRLKEANATLAGLLESALAGMAKAGHIVTDDGYCAACEGGCMLGWTNAEPVRHVEPSPFGGAS